DIVGGREIAGDIGIYGCGVDRVHRKGLDVDGAKDGQGVGWLRRDSQAPHCKSEREKGETAPQCAGAIRRVHYTSSFLKRMAARPLCGWKTRTSKDNHTRQRLPKHRLWISTT